MANSVVVHATNNQPIESTIKNHFFNRGVKVILLSSQEHIPLLDSYFYYQARLPLLYFIDENFIRSHGNTVYALSHNTRLDTGDAVCLAQGKLVISLCKESYYSAGLSGEKSTTLDDHYLITIELTDEKFKPGNPRYDRVQWCFRNTLTQQFEFLLASQTSAGDCLQLDFSQEHGSKRCKPVYRWNTLGDIYRPDWNAIPFDATLDQDTALELLEWVGMVSHQS
ncbi:Ribonuclease P protein subunit p40, partial [Kappamyces sp. JEL0680]